MANSWFRMVKAAAQGEVDISIYDEIGFFGVLAADFKDQLDAFGDVSRINLRMHSPGGAVFEGVAIYNMLRNHPAEVHVHIDGLAASIASVIAMAGDVVTIPENAFLMVHKPWVMATGDAEVLRESADLLDTVERALVGAYREKTGLSDEEISELLAAETWLTGDDAVTLGFADQLAEPVRAAASFKSGMTARYEDMPSKAKQMIGDNTDPQNTPAPAAGNAPAPQGDTDPAPAPAAAAPAPGVTREQVLAEEASRRADVRAVFANFDEHSALRDACLDDMRCTAEVAREKLLAELGKGTTPSAAAVYADNGNVVGDSIRNSIEARIGLAKRESDNTLSAMTLLDLARASLVERGVGVSGLDRMSLVANAFTHSTSDFGSILQDVAQKSMLRGYQEAEETFQRWTNRGVLTDFKLNKRVDLSNIPSLRKVPEGAEYKYVTTSDREESIVLATYGELLSITRQAIIDDDLSAFDRIPRAMGRAAIRTIGDLVYAVLTGNATMADGKALFHADHNNIVTEAFSVAAIDAAKSAMMTQKEGSAHSLNIRPAYMLTPVAREARAKAFLGAEFDPAYTDKNVPNPVRDLVEVIADARLDDASTTTTYMTASPGQYDTVEVAYLDGNDSPYLEQREGFTVDGATFKVRMDAGVAPLSFRTMARLQDS